MRHLVYNVRYSVVPINSALLTATLFSSVRTTLLYSDTKFACRDNVSQFDCTLPHTGMAVSTPHSNTHFASELLNTNSHTQQVLQSRG